MARGVPSRRERGGHRGCERLVGLPVPLGADSTPNRVIAPVEGDAWRMDADDFRRVVDGRPVVRRLRLRYAQDFADQLARSAACNRLHAVDEWCAPWLPMTHDLACMAKRSSPRTSSCR